MWPNPQETAETADLVTFTEEILNGKLHFLTNLVRGFLMRVAMLLYGFNMVTRVETTSTWTNILNAFSYVEKDCIGNKWVQRN